MKKCILVSRFNVSNIGDLVISNNLFETVSKSFEVHKYNLFGHPYNYVDINNIPYKHLARDININRFLAKYHLTGVSYLYTSLKRIRKKKKNTFPFEQAVENYDFVIIGGGNMIFEINESSKTILRFQNYVTAARKNQKPIFAMDIGIGPFISQEQKYQTVKVLNECDFITFRDQASFDIYAKNGGNLDKAFISIDSAFFLECRKKSFFNERETIGINVFNNKLIGASDKNYKEAIKSYAKLADSLISQLGVNIVLFTTEYLDNNALKDIYNIISNKEKVELRFPQGLNDLLELYDNLSLLIGTRMHSMIISYTQLTPVIGLSWQQKVNSMFEIIGDKKSLFKFDNFGGDIQSIVECCNKKLNNVELEKSIIENRLELIRKKGDVNKYILSKFNNNE